MNYQPAYDGLSRSISTRSRRPSISYGYSGGYPSDHHSYYPEPRSAPLYAENYHHQSSHAPLYTGGELSRYSSRHSYDDLGYYDDPNYSYGLSPNKLSRRHRRHSAHGSRSAMPFLDGLRHPTVLKFKMKGSYHSGVSLTEAMDNVRLSGDKSYSYRDLSTDSRGNMYMKIMWSGYSPLTYEIPIDSYDGRMSLQTMMRRVGRACLHYIQSRAVPIHPDRVIVHSIEEITPGTWQPVMTVQ